MNNDPKDQRREEIFSEAAEITEPKARAEFLKNACGDDDQLRAEVEALLRHDQDAGSFLEKRPEDFLPAGATDPATDGDEHAPASVTDPTVRTGQAIGHDESWRDLLSPSDDPDRLGWLGPYEVIEPLGRGGMGVVLRAFDPKLSRVVAIKLLVPELAVQAAAVQRFLREARAAAAVSHDHVVAIYAIDDDARPPMIAMELIDGLSLQQKIDSTGALDVKSILRIGMQTAAGLAAAHRQGLVHRDVKPSNILLENGIEKVKLSDFGLARAVDDIGMTRTGQITGTPQYMSPEQAQALHIDHRTDLFSLGCVLYAMCTGSAAFRADSAVAVMHQVVHYAPRPIRELNPDIPAWLCEIVDRLLAKNPDERFASAEEVEDLLGRHLAHLQQPHAAPQPARIQKAPTVLTRMEPLDTELERQLNRVGFTLFFVAFACVASAFLAYSADDQAWYPGSKIIFVIMLLGALIVFPITILGSIRLNWGILLGRRPGQLPVLATKVAMIPWSPLLLLTLPWVIRARRILLRPEVLTVLGAESQSGQRSGSRSTLPPHDKE